MKVNIPRVIQALQESENDPRTAVRSLNAEAMEREAEAEALRQVANTIELLTIDGGSGAISSSDEPPKGMEAVRRVMREGGIYTGRSMLEELKRRGWDPKEAKHPLATVEAAMDRLYRVKKEIERVGRGEYTMKGFPGTPSLERLSEG